MRECSRPQTSPSHSPSLPPPIPACLQVGGSSSIVGSASSLPPSSAPSDFSPLPPLRVSAPMFTRQNIHSLSHSISGEHTKHNTLYKANTLHMTQRYRRLTHRTQHYRRLTHMTQHSMEGEHTEHITLYQVNRRHSTLANTEHIHTANIIQNIANIKQHTADILLKTPDMRPDDKTRLDPAQSCRDYSCLPSHTGWVHGRLRPSLQHGLSSLHIQWHGQLTLSCLWLWYFRGCGGGGVGGGKIVRW